MSQLPQVLYRLRKWELLLWCRLAQILSAEPGATPFLSYNDRLTSSRPVDVTGKEKEISQRVDKDRDRLTMSRTSSRTASERPSHRPRSPPTSVALSPRVPSKASNVKPTLSFANVAANKVFGVDHETQIPEDDKAEDNVL